jgi:hypothetical protein
MKFLETEFSKDLITKSARLTAIFMKHFLANVGSVEVDDYRKKGSREDLIIKETFFNVSNLRIEFEKISKIPFLIDNITLTDNLKENELTEIFLIQYHYENFITRLVSLADIVAKVVNSVYELGIETKYCNCYPVMNRTEIAGTNTSARLKELYDYLDDFRNNRHIIIHKGGFESEEIKSIDSNIFDETIIPLEGILKNWFEGNKKQEIKNLQAKMSKQINKIDILLAEIFESMKDEMIRLNFTNNNVYE